VVSTSGVPAVTLDTAATQSSLRGSTRNPFAPQKAAAAAKTASTTKTTTAATAATSPTTATGTTGSTTSGGTGTATAPTTTTPTTTLPPTKPPPPPPALTATQSYSVAVAITDPNGGFSTHDPLQRLSILPSGKQPLVIELGVSQGGHKVLFVVQPLTRVSGPGTCTPGPIDCEILSLAPGQTEQLSWQSPTGLVAIDQFAVTAITVDRHSSAAAAYNARRTASAAGRLLLSASKLSAVALFQYEPSIGAVVDLRNLTVGGS
jgi:hypothetical protein